MAPDPTPLVPPTPPTTADAADFEYPLGMPYTLTQWRLAGHALTLRSYLLVSASFYMMFGLLFCLAAPGETHSGWVLCIGIALICRAINIFILPHPIHLHIDAIVLALLSLLPFKLSCEIGTMKPDPGSLALFSTACALMAIVGVGCVLAGLMLWLLGRRYFLLAKITIPPELTAQYLKMRNTLVFSVKPDPDVIGLRMRRWDQVTPIKLRLLDGYALVQLEGIDGPQLLCHDEVVMTVEKDGPVIRVVAMLGKQRRQGWMSREHLQRLRAWKGKTDA